MAIAIMGGLLIATVLTLIVVPALYSLWFGVKQSEVANEAAQGRSLASGLSRGGPTPLPE